MSTMKIGNYSIVGNTSEHAYATMDHNGKKYEFACYGGISGDNNVFPTQYYYDKSIWYTRSDSKTNNTSLSCHPQIAVHLASWSGKIDMNHLNYNRKSGGDTGLGDNSGIVYALTGVCHQMCNIVTCATNVQYPLQSLINWPPSLNASKLIYGNRGSCGIDLIAEAWVRALVKFYGVQSYHLSEVPEFSELLELSDPSASSELQDTFNNLNAALLTNMRIQLTKGVSREERYNLIRGMIDYHYKILDSSNIVDSREITSKLIDTDSTVMSAKHNLDNQLLLDEISYKEYADQLNSQISILVERYAECLGEQAFESLFLTTPDAVNTDIINVEMMPESYGKIKELLGI